MARNPNAGHRGAQGRKHRCHECNHRPGKRAVTLHKASCTCICHRSN